MLETAVGDGAKKFGLQQEIAETGRVDTDVTALGGCSSSGRGSIALLLVSIGGGTISGGSCGFGGLELLVGVVDEIFLGRHGEGGLEVVANVI